MPFEDELFVLQITNIALLATKEQLQTLFGIIGEIEDIRLYPTVYDAHSAIETRVCYVRYVDKSSVAMAQHLINTVFIDRALIVIPVHSIPEERCALEMLKNGTILSDWYQPNFQQPQEVINRIEGEPPKQVIKTYDQKLVDNNLPEYPALPVNYDEHKVEEIRRTIIVCDIKHEWTLDNLIECFQRVGEVKYARWAVKNKKFYCMIEFCDQANIINALKMQGKQFKGAYLNVYHSTDAIIKPKLISNESTRVEIENAMTIFNKAQKMISDVIDPVIGMLAKEKSNSTATAQLNFQKCNKNQVLTHYLRSQLPLIPRKRLSESSSERSEARSSEESEIRSPKKRIKHGKHSKRSRDRRRKRSHKRCHKRSHGKRRKHLREKHNKKHSHGKRKNHSKSTSKEASSGHSRYHRFKRSSSSDSKDSRSKIHSRTHSEHRSITSTSHNHKY